MASAAPSRSQFLGLPPELLILILKDLDASDLRSCLKTNNRFLNSLVKGSLALLYGAAKQLACVEETQYFLTNYQLRDRSDFLRRLQHSWLDFTPTLIRTLTVGHDGDDILEFAWQFFFLAGPRDPHIFMSTSLKYAKISTVDRPHDDEWEHIEIGKPILDFTTAIQEHNLIAAVTYSPHLLNPAELASVDIVLLDFETQKHHALAAKPVIHVHDVELLFGLPEVTMEISGDHFLLSIGYADIEDSDADALIIYDWKSGRRIMIPVASDDIGATFLADDSLLVANHGDNALDIYNIPSVGTATLAHSFLLPSLGPDYCVTSLLSKSGTNTLSSMSHCSTPPSCSRQRYTNTPEDSIIVVSLQIGVRDADNDDDDESFTFVFHRSSLLRGLRHHTESARKTTPWYMWGPPVTRWFDARTMPSDLFIRADLNGQRLAWLSRDTPCPIHVLNFNPATLSAVLAQQERPTPAQSVTQSSASIISHPAFLDPVSSYLPYVETVSAQNFSYGILAMDEEHILGITFDNSTPWPPRSIDVLHFG
ncbi:hypothetical protein C8R43DRAFT_1236243 [Mycena crocata]|nr:hypothetical protein C8R43DRAFT_1236243 [Mycena crocata]